ncbi:MAG: FAD-dependent oxidoreductase, partial [Armatimonadetes bacterium]|nr:FAD-dependent oxidoreductase [Armatimonadota bacterium]
MTVKRDEVHGMRIEPGAVLEAPRRTPLRADVDVLVCGAGPAGLGAALAAAREGARVLLCERWGEPGGVWTAGLLNPFFEPYGRGWVVDELRARLESAGAWRRWLFAHCFDTEAMRRTLEAMLAESGVELLYGTLVADAVVEDGRVRGAILESKAGREAVTARVCIDATGDGDLAARAGCPYELGRERDGLTQPMTLMFEIRGITAWEQQSAEQLYDAMAGAIAEHGLDMVLPIERCNYAPWIINTPAPGTADVQLTHVYRLNPLDPADLTAGTVACRQQAAQAVEVFRHLPGLEQVTLAHTAASRGVREARRVRGRYYLTLADLQAGCRFDDAVTSCAFGVDIH